MIVVFSLLSFVAFMGVLFTYVATMAIVGARCGTKVEEIALGAGPLLLQSRFRSTRVTLRLFPFSSYTRFHNPDEDEFAGPDDRGFQQLPISSRAMILLSGPLSSLLLGAILAIVACTLPQGEVIVGQGAGNVTPSAVPGLMTTGQTASIKSQVALLRDTFLEFFWRSATFRSLPGWGGYVGTMITCGAVATHSLAAWLSCLAILSLGNGLLNLLPIPILNGGSLVLLLIERVIGPPGDGLNERLVKIGLLIVCLVTARIAICDVAWLLGLLN